MAEICQYYLTVQFLIPFGKGLLKITYAIKNTKAHLTALKEEHETADEGLQEVKEKKKKLLH